MILDPPIKSNTLWPMIALLLLGQNAPRAEDTSSLPDMTVFSSPLDQLGALGLDIPAEAGSRLGLTLQETPASVEVISRDAIQFRGDYSSREAVTRATGITSAATPGNGSTALTARGFAGHGSVTQLYDGTRLYVGAGTLTFPIDTWPLERIEVLRGPASVLHGVGAIGAAINYVPKKPDPERRRHEAFLSAGSYHTFRTALGSGGPLTDTLSYQVNFVRMASGGFVERSDFERYALAASLGYHPSNNLALTLSLDGGRIDDAAYWGTPLIDGGIDSRIRRQNYNIRDDKAHYNDLWPRLEIEWQATPQLRLRNQIYYLTTDRHWRNLENYTYQPNTRLLQRTGFLEILHDQNQLGNRFDALIEGQLLGRRHRLLVGADINRIQFTHTNNAPFDGRAVPDLNPFEFIPDYSRDLVDVTATQAGFRTHTLQYALFAEYLIEATEHLQLVAGVRQDRIEFERTDLRDGTAFNRNFNPVDWRFGLLFHLLPQMTLYAQTSTGTDPLGSLITLSPAQADFSLTTGRQYEIGLKQAFWNNRGEWTVALFDLSKKNLLSRDPVDPSRTLQIGQQSSQGIEIALGLRPFQPLTIDANVTVLNAEFDRFTESVDDTVVSRAGNLPPNVPERTANLWLTYFPTPTSRFGAGLRYVGPRFADNANTVAIPEFTTVDAYAAWRPASSVEFTFRVRNAFNKDVVLAPYNQGTQFILGDPRTLELALAAWF